ncbi:MAG: hypothetical protein ACE5G2_06695 [Candidatus Krumholzibacteriia bacterium]
MGVVLGASTALAGQPIVVTPTKITPLPMPVGLEPVKAFPSPPSIAQEVVVYENAASAGQYVNAGAGVELADDVHTTLAGVLTSFDIGYFNSTAAPVDLTITLYGNDALDGVVDIAQAGPYLISALPPGFNVFTITVPDTPVIGTDLWFAWSFSLDGSGMVISGAPATTGTSHDLFLDVGLGQLFWFGGLPTANFWVVVRIQDQTVPVENTTWSSVKALYGD